MEVIGRFLSESSRQRLSGAALDIAAAPLEKQRDENTNNFHMPSTCSFYITRQHHMDYSAWRLDGRKWPQLSVVIGILRKIAWFTSN